MATLRAPLQGAVLTACSFIALWSTTLHLTRLLIFQWNTTLYEEPYDKHICNLVMRSFSLSSGKLHAVKYCSVWRRHRSLYLPLTCKLLWSPVRIIGSYRKYKYLQKVNTPRHIFKSMLNNQKLSFRKPFYNLTCYYFDKLNVKVTKIFIPRISNKSKKVEVV